MPQVDPRDPSTKITQTLKPPLPRRVMFRRLPWGFFKFFAPICVDANDVATQILGLEKRLLRKLPTRDPAFLQAVRAEALLFCEELTPLTTAPSFDEWLATTSYNQARKDELTREFVKLNGRPPSKRQCQKISSFVKVEAYETWKHARWINSRSDPFKAWFGPWCKAVEHEVYKNKHFIKHTPVPDRPRLVAGLFRAGAQYWSTDYSSFEAQCDPEVARCVELVVFKHMLKNFPEVYQVLERTVLGKNRGSTRAGVHFVLNGRRMSGDMHTSLGNGLTNLILWSAMSRIRGLTWDGFVEGDDGIFVTQGGVPFSEQEWKSKGFLLSCQECDRPEEASFCGVVAVDGNVVRDPLEFCVNFGWTSSMPGCRESVAMQLLRAKALSACYETPQCPIVGVLARKALEITRSVKPRFIDDGYHHAPPDEFKIPPYAPSTATRELVQRKFGVSIAAQVLLETKIMANDMDNANQILSAVMSTSRYSLFVPAHTMSAQFVEETSGT